MLRGVLVKAEGTESMRLQVKTETLGTFDLKADLRRASVFLTREGGKFDVLPNGAAALEAAARAQASVVVAYRDSTLEVFSVLLRNFQPPAQAWTPVPGLTRTLLTPVPGGTPPPAPGAVTQVRGTLSALGDWNKPPVRLSLESKTGQLEFQFDPKEISVFRQEADGTTFTRVTDPGAALAAVAANKGEIVTAYRPGDKPTLLSVLILR